MKYLLVGSLRKLPNASSRVTFDARVQPFELGAIRPLFVTRSMHGGIAETPKWMFAIEEGCEADDLLLDREHLFTYGALCLAANEENHFPNTTGSTIVAHALAGDTLRATMPITFAIGAIPETGSVALTSDAIDDACLTGGISTLPVPRCSRSARSSASSGA